MREAMRSDLRGGLGEEHGERKRRCVGDASRGPQGGVGKDGEGEAGMGKRLATAGATCAGKGGCVCRGSVGE